MTATQNYRAARDQLLALRGQQERAVAEFVWPDVGERFNWAIDWFDAVARGNDRPALIIVDEDATTTERTFAEMAQRSDQVAAWLAGQGVNRGDAVVRENELSAGGSRSAGEWRDDQFPGLKG